MRMFYEEDILDLKYRQAVIEEIRAPENVARKNEALKRYEVYRDKSKKWVQKALISEGLKPETINQMINRAANISICKKIVNKKARVYLVPPVRMMANDDAITAQLEAAAEQLQWNAMMRKADRYRELQRNCEIIIVPRNDQPSEDDPELKKLVMQVLAPWEYDVIEDASDRECKRCLIISEFYGRQDGYYSATESEAGVHKSGMNNSSSNRRDERIADDPADSGQGEKERYVWWTDKYHFTTDGKGMIIEDLSPEDKLNPIKRIPSVTNSDDQDGEFWAQGGDDLIDGSILINKLLTDMYFIQYLQGFGQIVVTGQNISKEHFTFGPNNAIILDYKGTDDEPRPEIDILANNPPIQDWMQSIELYLALLLSTNNLSPSNVASKLDVNNMASGVALLIEQSEVTEDITEKQSDYMKIESDLVDILSRWTELYNSSAEFNDTWAEIGPIPMPEEFSIKYREPRPPVTEREKLENIKLRKELKINELVDLLMIDNPDLTQEQAEEKLKKIAEESMQRMSSALSQSIGRLGSMGASQDDTDMPSSAVSEDEADEIEGEES